MPSLRYTFAATNRMNGCPPDMIMNPETLRCVKRFGKVGKAILKQRGALAVLGAGRPTTPVPPLLAPAMRMLVPTRRVAPPPAMRMLAPTRRVAPPAAPAILRAPKLCPPDYIVNPTTGRCVKIGGRTLKKLHTAPISLGPAPQPGKAMVVPNGERENMRHWIENFCANGDEPFTGRSLRTMQANDMQEIVRTTAGTCARARTLDAHIQNKRGAGQEAMDPLNPYVALGKSDFDAIGKVIRRENPYYHTPTRKTRRMPEHMPIAPTMQPQLPSSFSSQTRKAVPQSWKLFIGKDARSGDDFYSVFYYDSANVRRIDGGIHIPPHAIKVDVGIFPSNVGPSLTGSMECNSASLVNLFLSLHRKKRLLESMEEGFISRVELPKERPSWKNPDGSIQLPFMRQVCNYLKTIDAA